MATDNGARAKDPGPAKGEKKIANRLGDWRLRLLIAVAGRCRENQGRGPPSVQLSSDSRVALREKVKNQIDK